MTVNESLVSNEFHIPVKDLIQTESTDYSAVDHAYR